MIFNFWRGAFLSGFKTPCPSCLNVGTRTGALVLQISAPTYIPLETVSLSTVWHAGGDGELAQIVAHLRKQQDILSAELDLAQQESARLRNDLSVARRLADAASAQMADQTERARQSVRTEEEHAALMQKVEQLNWLRDSNNKLRCAAHDLAFHSSEAFPQDTMIWNTRHAIQAMDCSNV